MGALNLQNAEYLPLVCTDPTTPAKDDPVICGTITGVATAAEDSNGVTVVDVADRVYKLSVKGVDGSGNSAVAKGDKLYYVSADTPKLSKKATGVPFGYALETVGSGSTATIKVLHHLL